MMWMFAVYAVDTHEVLIRPPYRYETEETCEIEAASVTKPGVSYAGFRPVWGATTRE